MEKEQQTNKQTNTNTNTKPTYIERLNNVTNKPLVVHSNFFSFLTCLVNTTIRMDG